jgi:hypothetical protein
MNDGHPMTTALYMKIFASITRRTIFCSMTTSNLTNSSLNITIRSMASTASIAKPRDPNTLSNYNSWATKHTAASFAIDFKSQVGIYRAMLPYPGV